MINQSEPALPEQELWKVELVVADELITQVVAALRQSHPYETPAYEVWRLAEF